MSLKSLMISRVLNFEDYNILSLKINTLEYMELC